ncbi:MAG TPA: hypothetical protein VMP03_09330 [Methylomirabilota bacterium]|nr:hypothetical protein [Methylomirabilota bacterium]
MAVAVLHAALVLPNHADRITPLALARVPVEAIGIALLLLLARDRRLRGLAPVAGVLVAVAVILKIADIAAFQAFARPFNPVLDLHLLGAAMNLLAGAVGAVGAYAIAVGAALSAVAVLFASTWAVGRAGDLARSPPRRAAVSGVAVALAAWSGLWLAGVETAPRMKAAAFESALALYRHGAATTAALGDLAAFEAVASVDGWRDTPGERLFGGLRGKDVIVAFVESYGRTVIDDPRYAPAVTAVLEDGARRLAEAGVAARSGFLTSPTVGGMSWLAHGTALSGLWVDNQRRYDSLMVSDRMTLNRAFRSAGWRTVALMPAITMAWPEGAFYGYDRIYAAADLGYRGKPFNWVTMPDQYTWSALRALELDAPSRQPFGRPPVVGQPFGRPPVMAEIALISSHAPWTPIPRLIPWDRVGDGRAFDAMAAEGDPPNVVWRDPERVRLQFRLSIEYALETLVSYAETFDMENTVIVVLGDHQPAPLVTGEDAGRDVPIHILSGDSAVLAAVSGWGWTDGLLPAPDAPVWPMDALRDRMIEAFSPALHPAAAEAEAEVGTLLPAIGNPTDASPLFR